MKIIKNIIIFLIVPTFIFSLNYDVKFLGLKDKEVISVIKEAALFGRGLHLTVEDSEAAMPMIATALQAQKADYTRLEKIRPSLEDVFVAIIEARDSQTGLQAVSL